jgi:uroporphyrin-III C-methyltransferase
MGLLCKWTPDPNNVVLMVGDDSAAAQKRHQRLKDQGLNVVRRSRDDFTLKDVTSLGRKDVDGVVDAVFINLSKVIVSEIHLTSEIVAFCKKMRVPVTVTDQPELCSFSLLSTYTDGDFQIGITTNGKGCRLADRLKRHIVSTLPKNVNQICQRVGDLRDQIRSLDKQSEDLSLEDDDAIQPSTFNKLATATATNNRNDRMRFLTQVVEYYPLDRLTDINLEDLAGQYADYINETKRKSDSDSNYTESRRPRFKKGRISLVGSGPGSQDLLTISAFQAIKNCDVILSDKLVPEQVLELIPKETTVHIAKKFPGNADKAQQEFLELAIESLNKGLHVVRLKQGDPYIFGRGAEEYLFFREHGYHAEVHPGITSALSGPLLANISPTHRSVADQILICTGTGRGGSLPRAPEYVESRTTVFLMALHRIEDILESLLTNSWDPDVACAIIERASCPDQRVVRTRLKNVGQVVAIVGSRPPGILVVGRACEVIESLQGAYVIEEYGTTTVKTLDD